MTAELDFHLLNDSGCSTCSRWQGESVVDLVWDTTAALRIIRDCKVMKEMETLSDRRYLLLRLQFPRKITRSTGRRRTPRSGYYEEDRLDPQLIR